MRKCGGPKVYRKTVWRPDHICNLQQRIRSWYLDTQGQSLEWDGNIPLWDGLPEHSTATSRRGVSQSACEHLSAQWENNLGHSPAAGPVDITAALAKCWPKTLKVLACQPGRFQLPPCCEGRPGWNLGLRIPGVCSIPCYCSQVYIGQTGRSIEPQVKKQYRHIRLGQLDKSAVAEHEYSHDHQVHLQDTQILSRKSGSSGRPISWCPTGIIWTEKVGWC